MKPFGIFAPRGRNKLITFFICLGLGRGKLKLFLSKLWSDEERDMPIDIFYHGLKLRLRRKSNSIEFKILFSSKLREEDELRAIRHSILLGGNFVDVGANVGYYSLMAAKFGAGKVIAIEPNPELIAKFGENIALNSFDHVISVVPVVLGEMARKTKLYLKRGDLGSSSLI